MDMLVVKCNLKKLSNFKIVRNHICLSLKKRNLEVYIKLDGYPARCSGNILKDSIGVNKLYKTLKLKLFVGICKI
jgi:hypothetical protein